MVTFGDMSWHVMMLTNQTGEEKFLIDMQDWYIFIKCIPCTLSEQLAKSIDDNHLSDSRSHCFWQCNPSYCHTLGKYKFTRQTIHSKEPPRSIRKGWVGQEEPCCTWTDMDLPPGEDILLILPWGHEFSKLLKTFSFSCQRKFAALSDINAYWRTTWGCAITTGRDYMMSITESSWCTQVPGHIFSFIILLHALISSNRPSIWFISMNATGHCSICLFHHTLTFKEFTLKCSYPSCMRLPFSLEIKLFIKTYLLFYTVFTYLQ